MEKIVLNSLEISELQKHVSGNGGFQNLMRRLQANLNAESRGIVLSETDLKQIKRYAFDYGNGGWEDRLKTIFERHLGPTLSRTGLSNP